MKILSIIGARPQFIKASVVSKRLSDHKNVSEIILHTGQHYDKNMSEVFFREMGIPQPDYNLNINNMSHGIMTGRMLIGIEQILFKEKPDGVIVYGDTNSTLAGALAAKKLLIPVFHVEAGLRSYNLQMPEEINRILTDRISNILFCPTDTAINNLFLEGYKNHDCKIIKSGDVMYDAALLFSNYAEIKSKILSDLNLDNYVLCTIHREENTNNLNRIRSILTALNRINNEIPVVLPLHPRTRKILQLNKIKSRVRTIEPVGYIDMIQLIKNSHLILTDSGGLQKEAFFFKKNCVTLRSETEWKELVEHGFNILAGSDHRKIYQAFQYMINKKNDFNMKFYGDGNASVIIAQQIANWVG